MSDYGLIHLMAAIRLTRWTSALCLQSPTHAVRRNDLGFFDSPQDEH